MGRWLILLRRLRFRKRVSILVIESRHGSFLSSVTKGQKALFLDPTSFPIVLSFKFFRSFINNQDTESRVTRYVLAIASACNAAVVIATDAVKELTEIARLNMKLEVVAVMHGFYVDQQGVNHRESWVTQQESSVSLFALGEYDVTHYRRWGNTHKRIFPVGSANNCLYLLEERERSTSNFDICIVQGALNPHPTDEFSRMRLENWEKIADFVSLLARKHNFSVVISLNASSKESEVKAWFQTWFSEAEFFRSSVDKFATYKAIDFSQISIGEASTALVEGLARGNKCLAMNFAKLDVLSLPVPAIASLRSPSFLDFEQRIFDLLKMSRSTYWSEVSSQTSHLINTHEQHLVISKIRQHVAQFC